MIGSCSFPVPERNVALLSSLRECAVHTEILISKELQSEDAAQWSSGKRGLTCFDDDDDDNDNDDDSDGDNAHGLRHPAILFELAPCLFGGDV